MKIEARRGKLGRWRWFAIDRQGRTRAQGTTFWGWKTQGDALRDAEQVMGADCQIIGGDILLYAGPRDFSD